MYAVCSPVNQEPAGVSELSKVMEEFCEQARSVKSDRVLGRPVAPCNRPRMSLRVAAWEVHTLYGSSVVPNEWVTDRSGHNSVYHFGGAIHLWTASRS